MEGRVLADKGGHVLYDSHREGGKKRVVWLFPDVLEVVKEMRARRGCVYEIFTGESAFFPKPSGDHYHPSYLSGEFSKRVNEAVDRYHRITPHTCRHYATHFMLERGADLADTGALFDSDDRTLYKKRKAAC
ncbi:tyrosine-type recombinase/integrase [Salibacterium aidingense]|uniref:tyrosine-type recombinase/integrase n=1 Tax=Salibacterium aidingense TaxID=384933 RepID=UPI00047BB203|nr:tyrosine-type recombinase/integrase [Salibacterium aidingense]